VKRGKAAALAVLVAVVTIVAVRAGASLSGGNPFAATGKPAQHAGHAAPLPRVANPDTTTTTTTRPRPTLPWQIIRYEPKATPASATPGTAMAVDILCLRVVGTACARVIGSTGERFRRGNSVLTIATNYVLQPLTNATVHESLGDGTRATPTIVHGGIGYALHSVAPGDHYDGYLWLAGATTVVSITASCSPDCTTDFSDVEVRGIVDTLVGRPVLLPAATPHMISFTTFDDDGTQRPFLFAAASSADGECIGVVAGQDGDSFGTPDPSGFSCDAIDWQGQHRVFVSDDGTFVYGAVRGNVAQVRLVPHNGGALTLTPGPSEVNGGRAYAFPLGIDGDYTVVALDHAGHALETWSSAANDFVSSP
jgi:hypothetical protein